MFRSTCALVILLLSTLTVSAQTVTWYDINPDRSNTDDDNPNGASGGRVNRIGATRDFTKVYAATEWGGLYQSFTQGSTWVRVNTFSPTAAWDVKVNPNNNNQVYVTSSFDGRANPQSGISISNDAGATWQAVDIQTQNTLTCDQASRKTQPTGWQIAINPVDPQTVFVGTSCGLARTTDGGVNWTFIDPSPGDTAEQIYAVLVQGRTVDVYGDNGHMRSTNNGDAPWSAPLPAASAGPTGRNRAGFGPRSTLAASPREPYVLYAAGRFDIFESVDGGATWPTSVTLPLRPGGATNSQGRIPFIKTNQRATSNQFDVWFGDINLFRATATTPAPSSIGGPSRIPTNTWSNVQDDGHWDNGDVLFGPGFAAGACPEIFANDGGVYVNTSNNDPSCQSPRWEQPSITPHATWLWGMDGIRLSPGVHALAFGMQDNGGMAATLALEGHNPPVADWNNYTCCDVLHNTEGGSRMLSLQGSSPTGRAFKLFKRNRGGGDPDEIANYPTNANFSRFESGFQNQPTTGNGYVVNLADGVYVTNDITDDPIGWTALNWPSYTPVNVAGTSGTGSIKVATLNTRPNVFFHTEDGNPENQGLIFQSTLTGTAGAAGGNWNALPPPPGTNAFTAWDVDPTNGNRIIVSAINPTTNLFEIHMTQDLGASWTRLTNLENVMLADSAGNPTFLNRVAQGRNSATLAFGTYWQPSLFKFNPIDSTTIVAGAVDAGVFLSLDDGANWQRISNPLNPTSNSPHIPRPLFAYFSPGRFQASTSSFDVWVGTRGAGVMKAVVEF